MLNREIRQGKDQLGKQQGDNGSWGYGIQTDAQESFDQIRERAESLWTIESFINKKHAKQNGGCDYGNPYLSKANEKRDTRIGLADSVKA